MVFIPNSVHLSFFIIQFIVLFVIVQSFYVFTDYVLIFMHLYRDLKTPVRDH